MILVPRTFAQVRDEWGWVKNGLQDIISRTGERWMPEDVWTALQTGKAFLFAISHNQDDHGFVIVQTTHDFDGPALFVWCAWSEPGFLIKHRNEFAAELRRLAKTVFAKRIRFESPRQGWNWVQECIPVKTIYECEV